MLRMHKGVGSWKKYDTELHSFTYHKMHMYIINSLLYIKTWWHSWVSSNNPQLHLALVQIDVHMINAMINA